MRVRREPLKVGEERGRWTVLAARQMGKSHVLCRCRCGTEKPVDECSVRDGKSVSCGCHKSEVTAARNTTHGRRRTPEWSAWNQMKQKCYNRKHAVYPDHGGKGISVCEAWQSFAGFYKDMGPRPSADYSLTRKNSNGNFETGNCRWARGMRRAGVNRRTRLLTHDGRTQSLSQWSRETGISVVAILCRLKRGVSVQEALTAPVRVAAKHSKLSAAHPKEKRCRNNIIARCRDRSDTRYGGRGISICRRWRESFDDFFADVGAAPTSKHTLGRLDNDGHYSCGKCDECALKGWPANTAWETYAQQGRNKSNNRLLTHDGRTQTLTDWSKELGMDHTTLRQRLDKCKWSLERAMTTPLLGRQDAARSHAGDTPQPPAS